MLCFLGPALAHEEPFWTCKLTLEGLLHLWSHDLTVQDCIFYLLKQQLFLFASLMIVHDTRQLNDVFVFL